MTKAEFIALLKKYRKNKTEVMKLTNKIKEVQYYINAVTGISYEKIPGEPKNDREVKMLKGIEKKDILIAKKELIQKEIVAVESRIARLNSTVQFFLIEKYFIGKKWEKISRETEVSVRGIKKMIDTELERVYGWK